MRITTANAFERSVDNLQRRQQELQLAQDRLTSGKRVARASDDPAAAARSERALATSSRAEANQRGLQASRNAMQQTETALGGATEALQQVRELLVAAGNGSYTDAERANLGARVRGLRDQLLSIANRGDGAGGYLFGGQGSAQPPFVDGPGGVSFRGAGGQAEVPAGNLLPMTFDGAAAWLQARSGNGVFVTQPAAGNGAGAWIDSGRVVDPAALAGADYRLDFSVSPGVSTYSVLMNGAPTAALNVPFVAGQAILIDGMAVSVYGTPAQGDGFELRPSTPDLSVFSALDRVAGELQLSNRSTAQVAQTVASGLRDIDAVFGNLQLQRAMAGESLNQIDAQETRLAESKLGAQTERSIAEDLDMVQALSDFQARQSGYDAALKTYSMVQRMSLFQYLNG
ncbi:MAG TPA: flagellar hook-associated protein FlgL [Rubrivivax sp.]|nr:flagellar hook-associated protein FlgL [Rubrivivax sp.]